MNAACIIYAGTVATEHRTGHVFSVELPYAEGVMRIWCSVLVIRLSIRRILRNLMSEA